MGQPPRTSPQSAPEFASFGKALKFLRRRAQLTQDELARAVDYSREQITKLENNQRAPDPVTVEALFLPALEISPDSELAIRLLELSHQAKRASTEARRRAVPRTNIPTALTHFIGREREQDEVKRLLASTRLLALIGAGGVGKTRLALQVGQDAISEYEDGVWVVELASFQDPALVAVAVATVFSIRTARGRSTEDVLADYLRDKQALLILDNCEHLLVACARFAEAMLRSAPGLRILATSRESLGILSATTYRVPSLGCPAVGASLKELQDAEAVRLFVDRACIVKSDFALGTENSRAISEICRRLDGIPLAIELAATRVRAFSVQSIAERLSDRFRLLADGEPAALPRHRTLKAMLDWSYNLLDPEEAALFRQLAVFPGGCALDTVEMIGGNDALGIIVSLVDKSLVVADDRRSTPRYRLIETIREYALNQLSVEKQEQTARQRQLEYFVTFLERIEPSLRGPQQRTWYERFDQEQDNFRAALEWAIRREDANAGLRLIASLWFYWFWRGHWAEGARWARAVLELPGRMDRQLRGRTLIAASNLTGRLGDYATYGQWLDEGTKLAEQTGDAEALAWARLNGSFGIRDDRQAQGLLEQALSYARGAGDEWFQAEILHVMGERAQGHDDLDRAEELFSESALLFRKAGDAQRLASLRGSLGVIAQERGDYVRAWAAFQECLQQARERQDTLDAANWSLAIARLALLRREPAQVIQALGECFFTFLEVNDQEAVADGLVIAADLANALEQSTRAAVLLGAADNILERFNLLHQVVSPSKYTQFTRAVEMTRSRLDEKAVQAAWESGRRALPMDVITFALEHPLLDSSLKPG